MNIKSSLLALTIALGSISASHAAIMIQNLDCTVPAKGGHILMGAPAPKIKVVTRSAISGTGTNYFLVVTPMVAHPVTQEIPLIISTEQTKEGWVNLETEGSKILIKEDNSKALIEFTSGASSKCKIDEVI